MRAAVAVVLGYIAWTALWLGGGLGLAAAYPEDAETFRANGALTTTGYLAAALALSVACSFVAGLVAARFARARMTRVVATMAALLLATGIVVQAGVWDRMPVWYHITFLVLIVPVCFAGARTRTS